MYGYRFFIASGETPVPMQPETLKELEDIRKDYGERGVHVFTLGYRMAWDEVQKVLREDAAKVGVVIPAPVVKQPYLTPQLRRQMILEHMQQAPTKLYTTRELRRMFDSKQLQVHGETVYADMAYLIRRGAVERVRQYHLENHYILVLEQRPSSDSAPATVGDGI